MQRMIGIVPHLTRQMQERMARDAGGAAAQRVTACAPVHAEALRVSARAQAEQPPRVVQRAPRATTRRTSAQPMIAIIERLAVDFRALRAGAGRQPEGVDVPHLPRHAVLRQQDAVQDARRRGLSDARPAEARRRRPVLPRVARRGLDRRRHVRAAAAAAAGRPRAHRRQQPAAARDRRIGAGVPADRRRARGRTAAARAARVSRRITSGGIPEVPAVPRRRASFRRRSRPARSSTTACSRSSARSRRSRDFSTSRCWSKSRAVTTSGATSMTTRRPRRARHELNAGAPRPPADDEQTARLRGWLEQVVAHSAQRPAARRRRAAVAARSTGAVVLAAGGPARRRGDCRRGRPGAAAARAPSVPRHRHRRRARSAPPDLGRFRINLHHERGRAAAAIRRLPSIVPRLATLGLPPGVDALTPSDARLVLVGGPTGSGKTTTLAALVNEINLREPRHIITIEDPIEYEHQHRHGRSSSRSKSAIDAPDFPTALRAALRQAPDIIVVGEMRDPETMQIALAAGETGHLVLSSLHTTDVATTIGADRRFVSARAAEHDPRRSWRWRSRPCWCRR